MWQADMYLEGIDQHRGWFQSSLAAFARRQWRRPFQDRAHPRLHGGRRPRKNLQEQTRRRALTKNRKPPKPTSKNTARTSCGSGSRRRIIRNDIVVSEERIDKVSGNLSRHPQRTALPTLEPLRLRSRETHRRRRQTHRPGPLDSRRVRASSKSEVIGRYDNYEFHVVYQKISQFVAVELSSIYHDVVKDRLYTDAANSPRRRSTQTALHRLVTGLCEMLAPILAFTADEAWEFVPGVGGSSVHLAKWQN